MVRLTMLRMFASTEIEVIFFISVVAFS